MATASASTSASASRSASASASASTSAKTKKKKTKNKKYYRGKKVSRTTTSHKIPKKHQKNGTNKQDETHHPTTTQPCRPKQVIQPQHNMPKQSSRNLGKTRRKSMHVLPRHPERQQSRSKLKHQNGNTGSDAKTKPASGKKEPDLMAKSTRKNDKTLSESKPEQQSEPSEAKSTTSKGKTKAEARTTTNTTSQVNKRKRKAPPESTDYNKLIQDAMALSLQKVQAQRAELDHIATTANTSTTKDISNHDVHTNESATKSSPKTKPAKNQHSLDPFVKDSTHQKPSNAAAENSSSLETKHACVTPSKTSAAPARASSHLKPNKKKKNNNNKNNKKKNTSKQKASANKPNGIKVHGLPSPSSPEQQPTSKGPPQSETNAKTKEVNSKDNAPHSNSTQENKAAAAPSATTTSSSQSESKQQQRPPVPVPSTEPATTTTKVVGEPRSSASTVVASRGKKRKAEQPLAAPANKKKPRRGGQKQKHRKENQTNAVNEPLTTTSQSHLSDQRFAELDISPVWKRAIAKEFTFKFLTKIQKQTLSHVLQGKDLLAKAKTGHGKTLAFLLPLMEMLSSQIGKRKAQDQSVDAEHMHQSIPFLIVSPTRELAMQIHEQAQRLCRHHNSMKVACFVGQQPITIDHSLLDGRIDFLIATPGRLLDHLHNDNSQIKSRIAKMQVLVLDEADRLLDMGFRTSIMQIVEFLPPKESRQTLLFSATFPEAMEEMKQLTLREDHEVVISTEEEQLQQAEEANGCLTSATSDQVKQQYGVCPIDRLIGVVEAVLNEHSKQNPGFKVMVFFNTSRETAFMATAFEKAGYNVLEMHAKKTQAHRTATSQTFRDSKRVMMFCSDVSARGMDYPDVTLVIQVGFVRRDVYIHRLGRTARAGKQGEGVLLLADFEAQEALKELEGLPLVEKDVARFNVLRGTISLVLACVSSTPELCKLAELAYQSWLCANSILSKRFALSRHQVVSLANELAKAMGLTRVPALSSSTAKKMRVFGAPGLLIQEDSILKRRIGTRRSKPY